MFFDQSCFSDGDGSFDDANGFVLGVLMMGAGDETGDETKFIGISFDDVCFKFEEMQIRIPILMR
jgi:hypothetical protein